MSFLVLPLLPLLTAFIVMTGDRAEQDQNARAGSSRSSRRSGCPPHPRAGGDLRWPVTIQWYDLAPSPISPS